MKKENPNRSKVQPKGKKMLCTSNFGRHFTSPIIKVSSCQVTKMPLLLKFIGLCMDQVTRLQGKNILHYVNCMIQEQNK